MAMRARSKSLHTRAVKVKVPGKHFSGLTPSEQKALYVFVCVLYMKNEFHSISLSTQCGPEAHTLIHCPLSDGPQAHT